jgi:hypothetical protein
MDIGSRARLIGGNQMIQLRSHQPAGIFGNLALQNLNRTGTFKVRRQVPRNRTLRTARHWELPNPFTTRVERILHTSVWTYVVVVVAITIVRNVVK